MSEFVVNAHRADPYKNFRFRVILDGRAVASVSRVSGSFVQENEDWRHHNDTTESFEDRRETGQCEVDHLRRGAARWTSHA
jgi:hypothetical protein